jgi:hypothetical protein
MTKQEIETALDNGTLWGAMRNGRFWKVRRNGQTKTWKTRPGEFSIPVKAGLKACARIDETTIISRDDRGAEFLISETDPNS